MFVLILSVLLLITHHGDCSMTATAVLYGDNSMTSFGTLTFSQDNAAVAVRISGTLSGLNASSDHVRIAQKQGVIRCLSFLGLSCPCNPCN